jgi:hypothetical protein
MQCADCNATGRQPLSNPRHKSACKASALATARQATALPHETVLRDRVLRPDMASSHDGFNLLQNGQTWPIARVGEHASAKAKPLVGRTSSVRYWQTAVRTGDEKDGVEVKNHTASSSEQAQTARC